MLNSRKFLLVTYFIYSSVYGSIPISLISLPTYALGNYKFVSYIFDCTSVL